MGSKYISKFSENSALALKAISSIPRLYINYFYFIRQIEFKINSVKKKIVINSNKSYLKCYKYFFIYKKLNFWL